MKRVNKRSILTMVLEKRHGWPKAFIGRFEGNITLMKPLLLAERLQLARRMVDQTAGIIARENSLQPLEFEEGFFTVMAESFFTMTRAPVLCGNSPLKSSRMPCVKS